MEPGTSSAKQIIDDFKALLPTLTAAELDLYGIRTIIEPIVATRHFGIDGPGQMEAMLTIPLPSWPSSEG